MLIIIIVVTQNNFHSTFNWKNDTFSNMGRFFLAKYVFKLLTEILKDIIIGFISSISDPQGIEILVKPQIRLESIHGR